MRAQAIREQVIADSAPAPAAKPPLQIVDDRPEPAPASPRSLEDVIEVFQQHLYLEDTTALKVVLGAVAANHMEEFDPVWVLIVGSSGGGKTELLQPLDALPDVHITASLTEAGLLSGSSKKDRSNTSTGGLLRKIGEFGIIVPKDFTTVLSMPRDKRAQLLAALREIYDGRWNRDLGTDGGQSLQWEGKVGLIGGVTGAIDSAHKVSSVMGERFLLCRLPNDDRREKAARALARRTSPAKMRAELQEAVAGMFSTVTSWTAREFSKFETDEILERAYFVATARSGVERDGYTRDVELILDPETPTRLGLQLKGLLAGLGAIGVDLKEAWEIVNKVALDSMPQSRRHVIQALYDNPNSDTNDIAEATAYPSTTARRTLEDLRAHGIVTITTRAGGDTASAHKWDLTGESRTAWERVRSVPETLALLYNPPLDLPKEAEIAPPLLKNKDRGNKSGKLDGLDLIPGSDPDHSLDAAFSHAEEGAAPRPMTREDVLRVLGR